MAKYCKISKKSPMVGNNVSHANNKTKRRFLPNLQNVSFWSGILNKKIKLRISTNAIRTIEHKGGFDNWLISKGNSKLDPEFIKIKKTILSRVINK